LALILLSPPPPPALLLLLLQVERALLDLCLDPSDSYLSAVAVDMGTSLAEGSITSTVRLYEVRSGLEMRQQQQNCSSSGVSWCACACASDTAIRAQYSDLKG
jgi:hypothetical protein